MAKQKTHAASVAAEPAGKGPPPRLKVRYQSEVAPKLVEQFGLTNPMSRPQLEKVILNVNMGRHLENNKVPANVKEQVVDTLTKVSGQKPVIVIARKSVANFKVREGAETSAIVTIRGDRAWHFVDRLVNLVTPRIKDFRGVSDKSFDSAGNYSMGVTEQSVFPEIDMARVNFTHGMNINIVFRNSSPEISKYVLAELGMPFVKRA